ncbi:MAG: hypothetical protein A3E78_12090 [Alphaproteobacteria bacterium RIFCSPHIGHO2_12_FULL_63_12]|nr:MAG: hypothetical protein A3E78_12090 [Alphaproteobacteria bacterium RIFCSPHIGHO2_12_FULL_63_12]
MSTLPDPSQPNRWLQWLLPLLGAAMIAWGASQASLSGLDRRVERIENANLGERLAGIEAKLDLLLRSRGVSPGQ